SVEYPAGVLHRSGWDHLNHVPPCYWSRNAPALAIMNTLPLGAEALSTSQKYSTLLEVAEAIVSHRDSATLFHELAGRLHLVVRFDYLACVLYDAASNTLLRHILETTEPVPIPASPISVEDDPAGVVLLSQQPMIISDIARESRWPRFLERAKSFGVNSSCY